MVGMNFADRGEAQSFSAAIESKVDQIKKTSESLCVLCGSLCSVWVPSVVYGSGVFCVKCIIIHFITGLDPMGVA